ncbi:DUF2784 domain-containing protein [Glycomyces rhizosphaerae]|uniref:DUF2784 domain-containing protein n=1 Tax=Glycomyces rhizosphaerae TaxID=2054422 RepID=A0ABV7PVJ2_9ACTN
MSYRVLADVVMTFHLLFLAFVVFGGFLTWRWPKVWFVHAPLALYGLTTVTFGLICPLTPIEHDLRRRAGQEGLEPTGFIDTYIEGLIYPADQTILARWLAFAVIVVSWAGLAVKLRRRRERAVVRESGRLRAESRRPGRRLRPGLRSNPSTLVVVGEFEEFGYEIHQH